MSDRLKCPVKKCQAWATEKAPGFYQCDAGDYFKIDARVPRPEPFLDAAKGEQLKAESMRQVDAAAAGDWKTVADAAARRAADEREFFTSDYVWALMSEEDRDVGEPRSMGPVMTRAAVAGLIEKTPRQEKSEMPKCHRREKRVWRSLVFSGANPHHEVANADAPRR